MATQEILVNYNADVSKLTEQLNKVASAQDKVSDTSKETSDEVKKSTVTQEQAAKKRIELLKKEEAELKKLQADRKKAFDPKVIADFDKKIAESTTKIQALGGKTKQSLAGVGSQITTIGASIATALGAAFTVGAIVNFSKASVDAFLEAQENAEKLRFTITQVGGESEKAFDRLIKQSEQLQDITIFSDDSIQQAQNALATFGLTSDQIEELLPKLADFASATKTDIVSAAQQVGAGLQGAGREFKKYGIEVSATASVMENLSEITEGFSKFQGAAAKETETLTGQLKQQANAADDLQESIGARLADSFVRAKLAAFEFFATVLDGLEGVEKQQAINELSDRERLELRIKADLQGRATINNLTLQANAEQELVKTGQRLRDLQKEVIANEIKHNPIRLTQLATEKKELVQTAGILTEIIDLEKNRIENEKKLAAQNTKEASDRRIAGSEEEIKTIKVLGAEYSALFELLSDENKRRFIELSVIAETDPEEFKNQVAQLALEVSDEVSIPVKLEPRLDDTKFNDGLDNVEENIVGAFLKANEQIIAESQALLSSLLDLYSQYNNAKIEKINQDTDAQISALDRQEEAVDQNLEKRRISEKQALKDKEQIERNRAKAEEEAQKKIRAIKKREFNLNKIAALAEIAIETAKKVTEAPIPLKPYYAAFGVAQAAIVSAQVNPYKKGSKDTGNKEHLALVGEEGPELMMMQPHSKILPAPQTRTYGEAIEAMRKKQFDQYISEKYVVPALLAQREKSENIKSKTFADNISSSIVHNYSGGSERSDFLLEKISKGITIRNVQEFKEVFQYTNRSYKR